MAAADSVALPEELGSRRIVRRGLGVLAALAALALVVAVTPGLGDVRHHLGEAAPGWVVLAVVLEVLSSLSYVVMFRPTFCPRMSRRTTTELALSELGVGALVPAAGTSGLALGVWALRRAGMPPGLIGTRTVAFFLIKSAANFAAVAVIGTAMGFGLLGAGGLSPALTFLPAALSVALIAVVLSIPRVLGEDPQRGPRWVRFIGRSLTGGIRESVRLIKTRDPRIIGGSLGYWFFDNAVLWACFAALGHPPAIGVVLLGYLIGQLGGLIPTPGGIGGIDGGLVGTLIVYGAPLDMTAAAVLIYRFILFSVPLIMGAVAFVGLRRGLNQPGRPDLCNPPATVPVRLPQRA